MKTGQTREEKVKKAHVRVPSLDFARAMMALYGLLVVTVLISAIRGVQFFRQES